MCLGYRVRRAHPADRRFRRKCERAEFGPSAIDTRLKPEGWDELLPHLAKQAREGWSIPWKDGSKMSPAFERNSASLMKYATDVDAQVLRMCQLGILDILTVDQAQDLAECKVISPLIMVVKMRDGRRAQGESMSRPEQTREPQAAFPEFNSAGVPVYSLFRMNIGGIPVLEGDSANPE